MAKQIDENEVDVEFLKAGVAKTQSRLIFTGVVLFMGLIGFSVKTCAVYNASKPADPIPSVECIKVGGKWVPEAYTLKNKDGDPIRDQYSKPIPVDAYCDRLPKPQ